MDIFDFLKIKSPFQKASAPQFSKEEQNLPALFRGGLKESNFIPEPTRSLVFVTDENPSQVELC